MSLDQLLMLPPGYGFDSAGGDPPTVYTLVIDDLLTRHYPGTDQRFKLTATAGTTDWVESDDNATIYSASAMATDMQTKLRALTGYSGKVTVSGASTEAGDKYTFTITFDGSLGAVTLDFHASSQWYPTITLTEAVTQQGIVTVTGVAEVVTVTAGSDQSSSARFEGSIDCNFSVLLGVFDSFDTPTGWTVTSGGSLQSSVTFTRDATGAVTDAISLTGDLGITTVTQGVDAVTGQPEIHTITPTPVNPTGGACTMLGFTVDFDETPGTGGWGWTQTSGTSLSAGSMEFTNDSNMAVDDGAINPVNVSLTAPEITHSIS